MARQYLLFRCASGVWIPEKIAGPTSEKIAGPEVSRNEFFSKMKESSNNDLAVCSVRWRDS